MPVQWPKFSTADDKNIRLDLCNVTIESELKKDICVFWDACVESTVGLCFASLASVLALLGRLEIDRRGVDDRVCEGCFQSTRAIHQASQLRLGAAKP
jgi:hypothetical protein